MLWYIELIVWIVGVVIVCLIVKRLTTGPWNSNHPSLAGKVVIVTGANAGVGYDAAAELALLNP